jgi:hypothetical protein
VPTLRPGRRGPRAERVCTLGTGGASAGGARVVEGGPLDRRQTAMMGQERRWTSQGVVCPIAVHMGHPRTGQRLVGHALAERTGAEHAFAPLHPSPSEPGHALSSVPWMHSKKQPVCLACLRHTTCAPHTMHACLALPCPVLPTDAAPASLAAHVRPETCATHVRPWRRETRSP